MIWINQELTNELRERKREIEKVLTSLEKNIIFSLYNAKRLILTIWGNICYVLRWIFRAVV